VRSPGRAASAVATLVGAHSTHLSQAATRVGRFIPNLGGHSILGVGTEHNGWFRAVLVAWLPIAVAATVLAGTSYAMMQEVTRSSADDVPRAQAQRAADALSRGGAPAQVAPAAATDLATDLGPFLTVYGANGAVQATTAQLDGVMPEVPRGVLAQAKAHGIDRVT
jgi:hypothetical protein